MSASMARVSETAAGERFSVVLPVRRGRVSWLILGLAYIGIAFAPVQYEHNGRLWTIALLLLGMRSFWFAFSKYVVSVSPAELELTIWRPLLRWVKRYPLNEISNLRVGEKRIFTYRPWLAYDRKGKTRFFGPELSPGEYSQLLQTVHERFPQVAPIK